MIKLSVLNRGEFNCAWLSYVIPILKSAFLLCWALGLPILKLSGQYWASANLDAIFRLHHTDVVRLGTKLNLVS